MSSIVSSNHSLGTQFPVQIEVFAAIANHLFNKVMFQPIVDKQGEPSPGDGGDWIIECKNYHEYNLGGIEQGAKYICGLILGRDII